MKKIAEIEFSDRADLDEIIRETAKSLELDPDNEELRTLLAHAQILYDIVSYMEANTKND